jgi:hypothetical protein
MSVNRRKVKYYSKRVVQRAMEHALHPTFGEGRAGGDREAWTDEDWDIEELAEALHEGKIPRLPWSSKK